MYLPKLIPNKKNYIIVQKYDFFTKTLILYRFLREKDTTNDIELEVLKKDHGGYKVLSIAQYYGLGKNHQGIFENYDLFSISHILSEKSLEDNNYKTIFEMINSEIKNLEKWEHERTINVNDVLQNPMLTNEIDILKLSHEEREAYFCAVSKIRNKSIQDRFRESLLMEFNNKCAICNINHPNLLVASHIIPYSQCYNKIDIAGDSNNGLLLCPIHDLLFESGNFITFHPTGKIEISDKIGTDLAKECKISNNIVLDQKFLTTSRVQYLRKHNEMFILQNPKLNSI